MINLHVMFADDEPDIREIIDMSLALDPLFVLRGCASGNEALTTALAWRPDLILLDVMMPVMDGPMTLSQLRQNRTTAPIPVVFMTARTQTREVEQFKGLGAAGVIAKPFDPMALASAVRHFVPAEGPLSAVREDFLRRLQTDAEALSNCRSRLGDALAEPTLKRIREIAHALAGASGVYGFAGIGSEALALADAASATIQGRGAIADVEHALDRVMARIEPDRV
jgi:CheY-like chemotaxis protein